MPSSRGKRKASELEDDDSPINEDKEDEISMYSRIRLRSIKLIEINIKKARMDQNHGSFKDEEEDEGNSSILRCFCDYPSNNDDIVVCKECDAWQHIRCYYPQGLVPDIHFCVACRPRSVDRQGANERQKLHQAKSQRQCASSYCSVLKEHDSRKYLEHFRTHHPRSLVIIPFTSRVLV